MFMDRIFASRKSIYFEFAVVFLIALLVRGNDIFSLHWSCDDFLSIADPDGRGYVSSQLSQLRVFAALTTWLVGLLGTGFPPLGSLWGASHTAAMIVFALALRRLWIPRSPSIYAVLIGLLFTLFPYHINLLAFQLQHPSMVMSYLTGAYAIVNYNRLGTVRWLNVLALAASLSYQTMIAYFIAAGLVLLLVRVFERLANPVRIPWRETLNPVLRYALFIALGSIAYLVISLLVVHVLAVPVSGRTSFADLDQWPSKAQLLWNHLKRTAYGQEPSMARGTKVLQSLLWFVVSFGFAAQMFRQPSLRGRTPWLLLLFVVPTAVVCVAFLPTILMDHTSENPRNLLATIVLATGGLALSLQLRSQNLRKLSIYLASLLVFSYALITNTLSVDQSRLTQRDFLQASRMVERLDQLRGPNPLRTVVFVGNFSPNHGLKGREYYQSAFEVAWAKLPLLTEASGQAFQSPTDQDRSAAAKLAINRPSWPEEGSIAVAGDLGVIVLDQP